MSIAAKSIEASHSRRLRLVEVCALEAARASPRSRSFVRLKRAVDLVRSLEEAARAGHSPESVKDVWLTADFRAGCAGRPGRTAAPGDLWPCLIQWLSEAPSTRPMALELAPIRDLRTWRPVLEAALERQTRRNAFAEDFTYMHTKVFSTWRAHPWWLLACKWAPTAALAFALAAAAWALLHAPWYLLDD